MGPTLLHEAPITNLRYVDCVAELADLHTTIVDKLSDLAADLTWGFVDGLAVEVDII